MVTRSELRAQQREETNSTPVALAEEKSSPKHHILFRLWGIICLVLLSLTLLFNSTILNAKFMGKEITSSSLESLMLNQVNSSLNQYGISTSVLKKSDTDKIITQAVNQVYAGQKIDVDLSSVLNNVNSSVNSQLAQYGLSTSMLPAGSTSAMTSNINSIINSQLNTPAVDQLIAGIKIARIIVNILFIITLVSLLVLVVKGIWQHHLIASFSWIFLISGILYLGILMTIHWTALQVGQQQADLSPFITQIADAFQQRGFSYSLLMIVIGCILFIWQFVKRKWQARP